ESKKNLGTWPGQEELLKHSHGEYVVALSVDVVLDSHFVEEAIKVFEKDNEIGAVQPKIYKYEAGNQNSKTIDTCGFRAFRSRRIVNIGHGDEDKGQFGREAEIFAVEGAVPVFKKQALEDCRLKSQGNKITDPDFFWYGDDLDLAWRMRLLGWKQVFVPTAIAYHDRQTTKALAGGSWREFIKIRKTVPIFKRRLDWRNTALAIIKNDFAVNSLRDLPFIFWRQLRLWVYFLLFEPFMFLEIFRVAKMLPKMLKRRSEIMRRAMVSAKEMRKWFK
ncbi:MAG: glycosyltransferase family 2 protein, partial [bacterium]|nr:glycosyltransferase family 2 protein [bacterium]